METEQKIAILTLTKASDLTAKTRVYLANWLREKADEIEHGDQPYSARFRASLWSGRGLGWKKQG